MDYQAVMQAVYWFTGKHFLQLVELIIIDKRRSSKRGIIIIREIIIIRDGNINPGFFVFLQVKKMQLKILCRGVYFIWIISYYCTRFSR